MYKKSAANFAALFLLLYLDGADGAALGGLPDLVVIFRGNLVPGGGYTFGQHGENSGAEIDAKAAANAVAIDMNIHLNISFLCDIIKI